MEKLRLSPVYKSPLFPGEKRSPSIRIPIPIMTMFNTERTETAFESDEIQIKSEMTAKGQSIACCPSLGLKPRSINNAAARSKLNGKVVFVHIVVFLSPLSL